MKVKTLSIYAQVQYRWAKDLKIYDEIGELIPLSIVGAASTSNNTIYSNGQVVGTLTPGGWGTYQTYYAINVVIGSAAYTTGNGSNMLITFNTPIAMSKATVELYTHASYPNNPQMKITATSNTGEVVENVINATTVATRYELDLPLDKHKVVERDGKYYYRQRRTVSA